MATPIMATATAVWLVDNTSLTFRQIADFCGLHELEVNGIADGEFAIGIKGLDPVASNQLDAGEIEKGQGDPEYSLKLKQDLLTQSRSKRRETRYTPLSKRQDKPAAINWLVRFHPELSDSQIARLIGTTRPTIKSVRERTHWNMANIQPTDPVALGLCKQTELDAAIGVAMKKKEKVGEAMTMEQRKTLVSTEQSLHMETEYRMPSSISGLENFTLSDTARETESDEDPLSDAEKLFNLPSKDSNNT